MISVKKSIHLFSSVYDTCLTLCEICHNTVFLWPLFSRIRIESLNRNNWFTEILKTSILKVSKMICWKIWVPVIDT